MRRLLGAVADFFRETDKIMLILCVFTSVYGCMAVYSATAYEGSIRPLLVQLICTIGGVFAALFIARIDYERYFEYWYLIALAGLIPVILTFFIGFAPGNTDDKAWLDLGFTTFQPSELLKICFIITFSKHLSVIKDKINKLRYLVPACIHGAIPVLLIHFQGDDGTALVFAIIMVFMLWTAGVSWKYFVIALAIVVLVSPIIYFFIMNDEHRARILNMFNLEADIKGTGFQQWRGRIALANGGFFGQGYLKGSLTSSGLVPFGYNDFIFVSIGEELGFVGCLAVMFCLAAICFRSVRVAHICSKDSGKLICVGFFAMIFAQTIINIGMCISVLPVIGITLPFFSAGGTSLLCLFLGVGLVLSVYMHRNSRTIYLRDK